MYASYCLKTAGLAAARVRPPWGSTAWIVAGMYEYNLSYRLAVNVSAVWLHTPSIFGITTESVVYNGQLMNTSYTTECSKSYSTHERFTKESARLNLLCLSLHGNFAWLLLDEKLDFFFLINSLCPKHYFLIWPLCFVCPCGPITPLQGRWCLLCVTWLLTPDWKWEKHQR